MVLLFFVVGACIGSFLNVCIYRMPRDQSVVTPRSRCCECGKFIPWYNNIPILSWLILRGRSACCGKPFSMRYFWVEVFTAGLFAVLGTFYTGGLLWATLAMGTLAIPVFFIDLSHQIIPDVFSIGGALLGLILSACFPEIQGCANDMPMQALLKSFTGLLIGSSVILWIGILAEMILKKEAMGFGDVKLLGCIGAFCGWKGALFAIFGGAVIGVLTLIPVAITQRIFPRKDNTALTFGVEVPFGPFLVAAGYLALLFPDLTRLAVFQIQ